MGRPAMAMMSAVPRRDRRRGFAARSPGSATETEMCAANPVRGVGDIMACFIKQDAAGTVNECVACRIVAHGQPRGQERPHVAGLSRPMSRARLPGRRWSRHGDRPASNRARRHRQAHQFLHPATAPAGVREVASVAPPRSRHPHLHGQPRPRAVRPGELYRQRTTSSPRRGNHRLE
jgi:hypothetical protein